MKLLLLQFNNAPGGAERAQRLAARGFEVIVDEPRWPGFFDKVKTLALEVIVVDCSRLPSHGRETAEYLGRSKVTRHVPLFLINVAEADMAKTAAKVPTGTIVAEAELPQRLRAIQPGKPSAAIV